MNEKELSVKYADLSGNEIKLTKDEVVRYISTDSSVTEKEVFAFLNMCKYLKLNPFLKEIYLIKYRGAPATFVVSYQTLLKRAERNKNFDGYDTKTDGDVPKLTATAVVYRKDRTHPVTVTVHYAEAVKKTTDRRSGEVRPTNTWRTMPRWMLRKVALARALKEAFPGEVGNLAVNIEKPKSDEEVKKLADDPYGTDKAVKKAEEEGRVIKYTEKS